MEINAEFWVRAKASIEEFVAASSCESEQEFIDCLAHYAGMVGCALSSVMGPNMAARQLVMVARQVAERTGDDDTYILTMKQ